MAKKRLFAVVFLLFLPSVLSSINTTSLINATLSGEGSLYTGVVHDGETVSVDNFEFEFRVASEGGVVIDYDGKRLIVMKNSCKYKDNLHFCVGDIGFAYRNVTSWKDIYEAAVDIGIIKGVLTITKNIEKTKLLIGDTSEIEVFLENTGGREIKNVIYNDSYPSSIEIKNIEGCFLTNNNIEWRGSIQPNVIESCSYTLIGLKPDEYDSKAEASFFDGVTVQNAYSDEVEIEVQNYSLQSKHSLNKDKLEIGDFINLSVVLENINTDEKISVLSFEVDIPAGLKILKRGGLNKKGQTLSWRGSLESNELKNYTINMQAVRTDNTPIYIKRKFKVGKFTRDFTEPVDINIFCDCIIINNSVYGDIIQGNEINFRVFLFNPSFTNKFKDLKIDISSNLPFAEQLTTHYPIFDTRKSRSLYDYNIVIPEEGLYYYNISINYKSEYGQYFKNSKNILIKEEVFEETEEPTDEIINESGLVNETTEVKIGEEEIETETAVENVTEEIETTFFKMEIKKPPLMFVSTILILLLIVGIIIGAIEIKKRKKKTEPPGLEPALFTFLLLIFAISLFFLVSISYITGFVVYEPNVLDIKNNLSLLGAMVVLLVFLFLVIYRKEPIHNPKP